MEVNKETSLSTEHFEFIGKSDKAIEEFLKEVRSNDPNIWEKCSADENVTFWKSKVRVQIYPVLEQQVIFGEIVNRRFKWSLQNQICCKACSLNGNPL